MGGSNKDLQGSTIRVNPQTIIQRMKPLSVTTGSWYCDKHG